MFIASIAFQFVRNVTLLALGVSALGVDMSS